MAEKMGVKCVNSGYQLYNNMKPWDIQNTLKNFKMKKGAKTSN